MALNIEYQSKVNFKSLNTRREMHGEDYKLGMDITLVGNIDMEHHAHVITNLFGCTVDDAKSFWLENGKPRFEGLYNLQSSEEFDEGQTLVLDGKTFEGVKLKKIALTPQAKFTAQISVQIQISNIPAGSATTAVEKSYLKGEVNAEIKGQRDLLTPAERAIKEEEDALEDVGGIPGHLQKGMNDPLITDAIKYVCEHPKNVGYGAIQSELKLNQKRAKDIFEDLVAAKVLTEPDEAGFSQVTPEALKHYQQDLI